LVKNRHRHFLAGQWGEKKRYLNKARQNSRPQGTSGERKRENEPSFVRSKVRSVCTVRGGWWQKPGRGIVSMIVTGRIEAKYKGPK